MAFTARIGTSPSSSLGNLELGSTDSLVPPQPTIAIPNTNYFTGILGTSRTLGQRIVLGRAFMRLIASPKMNANLSFIGSMALALSNRLRFASETTIITQARRIALKVVQRTTTQLDTLPGTVDIASSELYPLAIDFTQYVGSGDTLSTPTAILIQKTTGTIIPNSTWLIGNALSMSGNIVQIPINVSALQLSQTYMLKVTVTLNTNKTLTATTTMNVVA